MNLQSILLVVFLAFNFNITVLAKERVVLTLNVDSTGSSQVTFTQKQLEQLPHSTTKTITHWTKGEQTFDGVLLSDILRKFIPQLSSIKAFALNDYSVDIPVSDLKKYPVLLAYKRNGAYMGIRDKGPLWIVYPLSDHPELNLPHINNRWIWQLNRIDIK